MTYRHLTDETNQERDARLQAEYNAYVSDCSVNKVAPINYMNWLASKKHHERNQQKGSTITAEEIAAASLTREDGA